MLDKLKKYDERFDFMPIYYDYVFEYIFLCDKDVLIDYLITILKLDLNKNDANVEFFKFDQFSSYIKKYKNTGVIVTLSDTLNVGLSSKSGKDIVNIKNIPLYYLTYDKDTDDMYEDVFVLYSDISNSVYLNSPNWVVKYLKKYYNDYCNGKRNKETCFMAALFSKSFTEFYEILINVLNKKQVSNLINRLIKMYENILGA